MLATAELVKAVADAIRDHGLENYVMDPVMVATSGDRLLAKDAEKALVDDLFPLASLVTPNLHEARILTGLPSRTPWRACGRPPEPWWRWVPEPPWSRVATWRREKWWTSSGTEPGK